jgi:hypothetical protein
MEMDSLVLLVFSLSQFDKGSDKKSQFDSILKSPVVAQLYTYLVKDILSNNMDEFQ